MNKKKDQELKDIRVIQNQNTVKMENLTETSSTVIKILIHY